MGLKRLASNSGQHAVCAAASKRLGMRVCTRRGVLLRYGVRARLRSLFFEAFKLNGSGQAFADVDRFRLGVHDVADRGGGGDQEKESERGEGHRCTRLDSGYSAWWILKLELALEFALHCVARIQRGRVLKGGVLREGKQCRRQPRRRSWRR